MAVNREVADTMSMEDLKRAIKFFRETGFQHRNCNDPRSIAERLNWDPDVPIKKQMADELDRMFGRINGIVDLINVNGVWMTREDARACSSSS